MDSLEEDMFAFSDEELPIPTSTCNPVKEYLMKQLSNLEFRIEKTKHEIKDVENTTKRILKSVYSAAQYGEDITSDSDSEWYNVDGEPVIKRREHKTNKPNQILIIQSNWKRIVCDKWIIGIVLQNTSTRELNNVQVYMTIDGVEEIGGSSMLWRLMDQTFWCRADKIGSHKEVVATVVFDLPKFDKDSCCDAYGTVAYEASETQYQTPVPVTRLCVDETVDNSYGLKFSTEVNYSILALKSTSVEKTIGIQIEGNPDRGEHLLRFLEEKSFKEISADVYVVKATGCLMYCLIEILPIVDGEARLRIFSRSTHQMDILLRLLRNQFPDIIVPGNDNCVHAAMVLIEELKLYLTDSSSDERQMARVRTDLLIS